MHFIPIDTPLFAAIAMIIGFALLIKGGDWTIESAVFFAKKFGVSSLVIGFTVVAFGTSLPELLVSVLANLEGSPNIALGNVLGSNIANILLIVGIAALFAPLVTTSRAIFKDLVVMLAATAIFMGLMAHGEIGRLAGCLMILLLVAYVFLQYRMAVKGEMPVPGEESIPEFKSRIMPYIVVCLGLVSVAVGADLLVQGAKFTASYMGVPDAVIALTIIAVGTSLPELSTSIIAVRKGHSEMALGNVIGSNAFNILMIIGIAVIIKPIAAGSFAPQLVDFDMWVTAAVSIVFALIILFFGKIARPVGLSFIAAYVVYCVYIYAIYMTP